VSLAEALLSQHIDRAPMLTHTHESRFRVPGLSLSPIF
jgi:hypothetical protein